LARLNRKDILGNLMKLRIAQGCQKAGLVKDIWDSERRPEEMKYWKHNLACRTIVKAREIGINIRAEHHLWKVHKYGMSIRDLIRAKLWATSSSTINR